MTVMKSIRNSRRICYARSQGHTRGSVVAGALYREVGHGPYRGFEACGEPGFVVEVRISFVPGIELGLTFGLSSSNRFSSYIL